MLERMDWREADRSGPVAETVVKARAQIIAVAKGFMSSSTDCIVLKLWICDLIVVQSIPAVFETTGENGPF